MEQIETFLTDPRFVTDGPLSLLDILPFAVMLVLLILSITGFLRQQSQTGPADPPTSAFEKLKTLGTAMVAKPLGQFTLFSIATAYLVLFFLALIATFVLLASVIGWMAGPEGIDDARSSLGLGALLVALLGAPFLVWRSIVTQMTLSATQKQTDLQDEALFNDKINAAATDLAARREVTKIVEQDGKEVVLTEWQDDLVTRAAAIDRLEGLAREAFERADFASAHRIARMLSIYVRELSESYPPSRPPVDIWEELAAGNEDSPPMNEHQIFKTTGIHPDDVDEQGAARWAMSLKPARRDIERAAQSLGRVMPSNHERFAGFDAKTINLSSCNLQGMDLRGLTFDRALFRDSSLIGAKLSGSSLREADLRRADLRWVDFGPSDW